MTEPRYDDGKLAKWYYSRNRTISDGTYEYYLLNKAEIDLEDGTTIFGSNKLLDKLNGLSEENIELKDGVEELNQICEYYEGRIKELKERNNRQAKRLDNLYRLVEEKDWRTLSDILDDFKRCEEQLQREWRTYE